MDLHEKLSNKQIIHILKDHYVNYHIDNEKIIGHEEFKNTITGKWEVINVNLTGCTIQEIRDFLNY